MGGSERGMVGSREKTQPENQYKLMLLCVWILQKLKKLICV